MKISLSKTALITSSLLTALVITFTFISPAFAEFALEKQADENCSSVILPEDASFDIVADPTTKLVTVSYLKNGEQIQTILSFRDTKKIAQCQPQVKELLTKVKEYEEKRESDTCEDLKNIIAGKKALPERDGKQINIDAAIRYVEKLCK